MRRINQAYVIPTSTTARLNGINVNEIDDSSLEELKEKLAIRVNLLMMEKENQKKISLTEKKKRQTQATFDSALLKTIDGVPHLRQYLGASFSLRNRQHPHLLEF